MLSSCVLNHSRLAYQESYFAKSVMTTCVAAFVKRNQGEKRDDYVDAVIDILKHNDIEHIEELVSLIFGAVFCRILFCHRAVAIQRCSLALTVSRLLKVVRESTVSVCCLSFVVEASEFGFRTLHRLQRHPSSVKMERLRTKLTTT